MVFRRLCTLAACLSALAADGKPVDWKGEIDALVKPLMARKKATGIVVGVLTPDGKRVFVSYGETKAGGPRPDADTAFEIGSASKPLTALLLARMVEAAEVKLSDPVQRHLPKAIIVPRRGKQEITLLELATHASGLPRNPPNQQRAVIKEPTVAKNP